MVVECLSIIIILLLTAYVFLRSRKKEYALLTVTLIIVPTVHFLVMVFQRSLIKLLHVNFPFAVIGLDVTALTVSCLIIGFISNKLTTGKQRKGFLIVACSYLLILTLVLLFNVIA